MCAQGSGVGDFYGSIATIFEAWVNRRKSEHTRRAYRGDVMAFVSFMGWRWPDDALHLLGASILDVQDFKAEITIRGGAGRPSTGESPRCRASISF